jgi:RND family efflux transporter MFP subunit
MLRNGCGLTVVMGVCAGLLALTPRHAGASEFECLLEPWQVLKIAAPVAGQIASVEVDRGDEVRRGQVLARLVSEVEEANVAVAQARANNDSQVRSARARLEFLRRKQARHEQLRASAAVSLAALDEATSDARIAEAQLLEATLALEQARLEHARATSELRLRQVISPVNGVVTERALGPGEYRNEQTHVLTVAETDRLRVEAYLPLAMHAKVRVGDRATVLPEAPIGGAYPATVTVVNRVLDPSSGSFGVRLRVENPDGTIPSGVHCRVRFEAGE